MTAFIEPPSPGRKPSLSPNPRAGMLVLAAFSIYLVTCVAVGSVCRTGDARPAPVADAPDIHWPSHT